MKQNDIEFGTMKNIPLTDIWKNEASDFTPWLSDNLDLLGDAIGMELDFIEAEKSVGPFFADIYAEDRDGNSVVIENQLGQTDHKHLGQIITYATGLKGKTMVWITSKARKEHANAIDALNAMNGDSIFYLIEISLSQIDNSAPAVVFNVVCSPKSIIPVPDPEKARYQRFWGNLIKIDGTIYKNTTSLGRRWLSITNNNVEWDTVITKKFGYVQLYMHIDNKDLYDHIKINKEDIEQNFGEKLVWTENEKSVTIRFDSTIGGLNDENKWSEIQHDLVNRMLKLKTSIELYLR